VPASNSYLNEVLSAARGVAGLVVGDRSASRRFDPTPHGLVGSFIGLLVVTAISAYLPVLLGQKGALLRAIAGYALLFACQAACSGIVLAQLKRLDGFVPYLVADNWASVFVTIGATLLGLAGLDGELLSLPLAVLVIVIAVNIARLVVVLPPLQVAMFVIAQLVGAMVGAFAVNLLLPLPDGMIG